MLKSTALGLIPARTKGEDKPLPYGLWGVLPKATSCGRGWVTHLLRADA